MTARGSLDDQPFAPADPWAGIPARLRSRGLRWTPQRRILVEVLAETDGHVTGADLVERCRAVAPDTIPSTVYRTLDVLEQLGVVRHSHGSDGREEFHVLPAAEHAHLYCRGCGGTWELPTGHDAVAATVAAFDRRQGFAVDVSHLSVTGLCADCRSDRTG
ncbi:MAG TPA: Fur family transcriptional regulator [Candidatus Limnocylindrales bacterium]|jgi:Fur family ferric uptake transcriptional regulator|nr:Fur family transcriptional regulator [Candidatus Limnocylindrales bacterium]